MHSLIWVWHFKIKIFIDVTNCMGEIVLEIVGIHEVVVDEHSSVQLLWF